MQGIRFPIRVTVVVAKYQFIMLSKAGERQSKIYYPREEIHRPSKTGGSRPVLAIIKITPLLQPQLLAFIRP